MLFNSFIFIFAFLPVTFLGYFALNRQSTTLGKGWLVACSLFFYGYWNPVYLALILTSLLVNFGISKQLKGKKSWLWAGILFNVGLLAYFKYTDFVLKNLNLFLSEPSQIPLPNLLLPLAISFFTFQQIAYLVDVYREGDKGYNLLDYAMFVTFFPQLIAGPIVHHKEMMPQFAKRDNQRMNAQNILSGLFIFTIGLFKKVVIADTFAQWATLGIDQADTLGFFDAWVTSLSYTFQLYYDFSGYCDMAIGIALMFNIKLPINFNSPYKATNIQDFWRRWHITLSNFLRDYIYIPLGGNRHGEYRTYTNLMLTFLIGGIWHGAGWLFLVWGGLHGMALVLHRLWQKTNIIMPTWLAWFITFQFVNVAWVFFRAKTWDDAIKVLSGMVSKVDTSHHLVTFYDLTLRKLSSWLPELKGTIDPSQFVFDSAPYILLIVIGIWTLRQKNTLELMNFQPKLGQYGLEKTSSWQTIRLAIVMLFCLFMMAVQPYTEFIYFNF